MSGLVNIEGKDKEWFIFYLCYFTFQRYAHFSFSLRDVSVANSLKLLQNYCIHYIFLHFIELHILRIFNMTFRRNYIKMCKNCKETLWKYNCLPVLKYCNTLHISSYCGISESTEFTYTSYFLADKTQDSKVT